MCFQSDASSVTRAVHPVIDLTNHHLGVSTGRTCDGYGPVVTTPSATPSPPLPLSPRAAYTGQEWRSFQYFHEKTLKQLCTFFPNDFWTSYVLKIASTETSIWHSLIALSSYHELFAEPHRHAEEDDRFALNQYNSSIQQVLCMDRSSQSAHVQLASCILFICVETLRGQIVPVVRLVTLGYRILQAEDALDKTFRPPAADASDRRKLFALARSFLSQVVCQIYVLINDLDPGINAIAANIIESGHGPGPRGYRFATAADAQAVLNSIRLHFDRYDEGAIETARADLAAWTLAFHALRRRATPAEGRALALLELRRLYFAAELSVNIVRGPVDPMLWDVHRETFVKILALAEVAMSRDDDDGDGPQFHMNSGAVPVLYGLVQKSRDRDLRARAIRLLAAQDRQEGVWSSRMALGTVMRVVAIEERGLTGPMTCADIPRENRVKTIKVVEKSPGDYTVGFELYTGWHWEDASAFLA
ncbi:Fungal transcriptional regulatory protein [Cordyceps fumosorosea ARSEF 2679]|uniref:Fungal transcriptional regulatory protein n=1 Tax=Cordyceps fumosorosea (strain ARSEF 2679) TaxID=1081104 RepID=A0A167R0J8_CORFA|nr:Fungal transcriptional regulatory protein [Cordyceps fumosorosea ARSEF 2679]OAA58162.1 Fungal transcriptional regulatory protein [Cordyceps fumosorosea ARSEF 2679]